MELYRVKAHSLSYSDEDTAIICWPSLSPGQYTTQGKFSLCSAVEASEREKGKCLIFASK